MLYFIQDESGPVKIGFSEERIRGRLENLQAGNPRQLRILGWMPGTVKDERVLHHFLAESRIRGEWFEETPLLLAIIDKYAQTSPPPQDGPGGARVWKKYRDKEWLEQKYVGANMSTHEIGDLLGCSHQTIWLWLKKHNIPCRDPHRRS